MQRGSHGYFNGETHLQVQPSSADPASTQEYSKASPDKVSEIVGLRCPGSPQTTQLHQPQSSLPSPARQATRPCSYLGKEERKISSMRKPSHATRHEKESHRVPSTVVNSFELVSELSQIERTFDLIELSRSVASKCSNNLPYK